MVARTQAAIASNRTLYHTYLDSTGDAAFTAAATRLLLGRRHAEAIHSRRAFGVQAIGGTGALHLGGQLLRRRLDLSVLYLPEQTYFNHLRIFTDAGFADVRRYRYWDAGALDLDFAGLLADLRLAPRGAVILLQACGHNPTGRDPTHEQWQQIAAVMQLGGLVPFFDAAYLGLVSGDPARDAWPVRHFVERGFELLCAQSFSKNFGLYGECELIC